MANKSGIWMVIGILAVLFFVSGGDIPFTTAPTPDEEPIPLSGFCLENPQVDSNIQMLSTETTSIGYIEGTVYYQNIDNPRAPIATLTIDATGWNNDADVLTCGQRYAFYGQSSGTYGGNQTIGSPVIEFADTEDEYIEFDGFLTSGLEIKAYDNGDAGWIYEGAAGSSNAYIDGVSNAWNFTSTTNQTAKTVGVEGVVDWTFYISANTSNGKMGDDVIVLLESSDSSNLNDWDELASEVYYNGAKLTGMEVSALTGTHEPAKFHDYDRAWIIVGGVDTSTMNNLRLILPASEDGSTNPDLTPKLKFAARSSASAAYLSDENPSLLITSSASRDDSSNTDMVQLPQEVTITIA